VTSIRHEPLGLGTSAANAFAVTVGIADRATPVELILKVSRSAIESRFYGDLAADLPVETPRIVARGADAGGGWILMERVKARPSDTWSDAELEVVVRDMARFHAANWGTAQRLRREWLTEITEPVAAAMATERLAMLPALRESWMADPEHGLFDGETVDRFQSALEDIVDLARPLWDAGTTLVHGDYWFHNVLLTDDGRRIMIDWQEPMIWSGLWELAYFINLLPVVGSTDYRPMPVPEQVISGWYRDQLAVSGVTLEDELFDLALQSASVLHPLIHWIPQLHGGAGSDRFAHDPALAMARAHFRTDVTAWKGRYTALQAFRLENRA